jgi:hypothetical protein
MQISKKEYEKEREEVYIASKERKRDERGSTKELILDVSLSLSLSLSLSSPKDPFQDHPFKTESVSVLIVEKTVNDYSFFDTPGMDEHMFLLDKLLHRSSLIFEMNHNVYNTFRIRCGNICAH